SVQVPHSKEPKVPVPPAKAESIVGAGDSTRKRTNSQKKLDANRRNARHSTGPRTEKGKRWSRRNAIKHDILTSELLIRDGPKENAAAFDEMLTRLRNDLSPVGELEELFVTRIAVCQWRLNRALRFERDAITRENSAVKSSDPNQPRLITREELKP